jgi:hypothetical protein
MRTPFTSAPSQSLKVEKAAVACWAATLAQAQRAMAAVIIKRLIVICAGLFTKKHG